MNDLIEALTIFATYLDSKHPTHCEHDVLYVVGFEEITVSQQHAARLEELGFTWGDPYGNGDETWYSFRFGSA